MSNDPREPDETLPPTDDGGGKPADRAAPKPDNPAPQQPVCPSQIGRYRVERLLGKGGFGLVYLAHDDQLQRHVAIKVPHRELTSQPADAEAYLAEARMLARLDHPHIVPVHDVGSTAEFPCFFVSKYIDGTNLARRMEQSARHLRRSGGIDGHRRRSPALRPQTGLGPSGHQTGQHPDRPQRQALRRRFRAGPEGSRTGQGAALRRNARLHEP